MCENDPVIDEWIRDVESMAKRRAAQMGPYEETSPIIDFAFNAVAVKSGHLSGVIRELAATVPGVREWLIANPPEGK